MNQPCMTGCGRLALWCGPCTEVDVEGNPDADWSWNAGYLAGAAALGGVLAMAEAIRAFTWRPFWECTRCGTPNYDMQACWCARCAPRRYAREVREGYPAETRGLWKESEC